MQVLIEFKRFHFPASAGNMWLVVRVPFPYVRLSVGAGCAAGLSCCRLPRATPTWTGRADVAASRSRRAACHCTRNTSRRCRPLSSDRSRSFVDTEYGIRDRTFVRHVVALTLCSRLKFHLLSTYNISAVTLLSSGKLIYLMNTMASKHCHSW